MDNLIYNTVASSNRCCVDNTAPIVSLELPFAKEQASGRLNIRYFIQELNPASVRIGYQRHTLKEWIWSEWSS